MSTMGLIVMLLNNHKTEVDSMVEISVSTMGLIVMLLNNQQKGGGQCCGNTCEYCLAEWG